MALTKRSEALVKASVRNWLNKHECYHFPYPAQFRVGMPDRILILKNGQAIFQDDNKCKTYLVSTHIIIGLEAKRFPDGKATEKQLARHEELRAVGWIVGVVRSVDDVKKLLAEHGIKLIKKLSVGAKK